jgi:hypothetical protein
METDGLAVHAIDPGKNKMNNLDWSLFLMAFMIGLLPAAIARHKGRDFLAWWVFGDLFFMIALPAAILMKPGSHECERRQLWQSAIKECPACGGINQREAVTCRYCNQWIGR